MPIDGRDVQCSNCGQTWFQYHPDHVPEPFEDAEEEDADEEVITADAPPPEPERAFDDEDEPEPDLSALAPKRKELDPAVADILREEAEIEIKARQNEPSGTVESQPDLGLQEGDSTEEAEKRAREASERMARMRGEEPSKDDAAEAAASAAALGSRRDLLPDIEEINSTLRSSNDRGTDDPAELANVQVREKRGFRRGFLFILLLAVIVLLIYMNAPAIAAAVPALEPLLNGLVGLVDSGRMWLDGQMTSLLSWLDAAATSSNG